MILAHTRWSEDGGRNGALLWILGASVGLHIVVFGLLPSARRIAARAPLPTMTIIDAPLPPPPPPPPPKLEPETPAKNVIARVAPPPTQAAPPQQASSAPVNRNEAPLDFTSTVFSGEGAGIAVGASRAPSVPAANVVVGSAKPSAVPSPSPAPAPPRVVDPASLARRPRAPSGLDVALEKNYPADARRSGISGTAVLRVKILPSGKVGEVRVMSESWSGFGGACERTVKASQWEPPIDKDGTPVTTEITYTCRFEVRS